MNRDDVIRMAREAGFVCQRDEYFFLETWGTTGTSMNTSGGDGDHLMLERFAALVAAHERAEKAETEVERLRALTVRWLRKWQTDMDPTPEMLEQTHALLDEPRGES